MKWVYHQTVVETSQDWLRIPPELRGHHGVLIAQCGMLENGGVIRGAKTWRSADWYRFAGFKLRGLRRLEAAKLVAWVSADDLQVNYYDTVAEGNFHRLVEANRMRAQIRWAREQQRLVEFHGQVTATNGHAPQNGAGKPVVKTRDKHGGQTVGQRSKKTTESPERRAFVDAGGITAGTAAGTAARNATGPDRTGQDLRSTDPDPPLPPTATADKPAPAAPGRRGSPDGAAQNRREISEPGEARLERFAATYPKWKPHWRPRVFEQFLAAGLDEVADQEFETFIRYVEKQTDSGEWRADKGRWIPVPHNFLRSREWVPRRPPKRPAAPAAVADTSPTIAIPVIGTDELAALAAESRENVRAARARAAAENAKARTRSRAPAGGNTS